MFVGNADEEIRMLERAKEAGEELNKIEADKLFIDKKQLAEICGCSEKVAGRLMKEKDFPLLKLGNRMLVNIFALNEYTQHRIILSDK